MSLLLSGPFSKGTTDQDLNKLFLARCLFPPAASQDRLPMGNPLVVKAPQKLKDRDAGHLVQLSLTLQKGDNRAHATCLKNLLVISINNNAKFSPGW